MSNKIILDLSKQKKPKMGFMGVTKPLGHAPQVPQAPRARLVPKKAAEKNSDPLSDVVEYCTDDEAAITPLFDLLIEGIRNGNQYDSMAAEALLRSMASKRISPQYYDECEAKYQAAMKVFNETNPSPVPADSGHEVMN